MRVVFVHGACVRDGSWWWQPTAALLDERGIASTAPGLPSCGETGSLAGAQGPGLDEDAAAVRAVLQDGAGATIVVAHSYGGIVAAQAAVDLATVAHLVLISSYLPEVGQSLSSFGGEGPAPFLDVDAGAGTLAVRPEMLAQTFLQDCPPDLAAEAMSHLADQSLSVTGQPVRAAAWQQVATTYLVCTEDRGTPASAQRDFARRAGAVVEVEAGHHPFISRPRTVADLVLGLARAA